MALEFNELLKLAKSVAKANPSVATAFSFKDKTYSYNELQDTLRDEFKEIAGNYSLYRQNKNTVFVVLLITLFEPRYTETNRTFNVYLLIIWQCFNTLYVYSKGLVSSQNFMQ